MAVDQKEKRLYWIKLKDSFLTSEKVDTLITSLPNGNGAKYVVIYQCLCLKSVNNDGELVTRLNECIIPWNDEKVYRICNGWFDLDCIRQAFILFKNLGLIYRQENDCLRITDYNELIGSETSYAQKKREYRESKKTEQIEQKDNVSDNVSDNVRQDIRDKKLDIRDKNIDIYNNNTYVHSEPNEPVQNGTNEPICTPKEIQNEPIEPIKRSSLAIYEERFEQFWKKYPKKMGKGKCLEWFKKKKPSQELLEQMLKTIDDFIHLSTQWQKNNGQYIPLPYTWLKQGRWDDEVSELARYEDAEEITEEDLIEEENEEVAESGIGKI